MTKRTSIKLSPEPCATGEDVVGQITRAAEMAGLTGSFVEVRAGDWDILMSPFTITFPTPSIQPK
jgi:hypothetical protein